MMAVRDLLLHICCGPCSIWPARELLREGYQLVGYFYNPNIHPLAEYLRRREGAQQCAERLAIPLECEDDWDVGAWLTMQLPERATAKRCQNCITQRLQAAASAAQKRGLPCYSTSLLYSRYQPHDFIRDEGERIGRMAGVSFVYRDFRRFWQAGIEESKKWDIYRQKYCGCIFSEAERYSKKLKNLQKNNQHPA